MAVPRMAISRPKYDCLKSKPGRVSILCCCGTGVCRRSNMACLGDVPGGRHTHILGFVAHVDVGSWISLGVTVICISPDGLHIQHGSGFEVPSKGWANLIVHVPKRRSNTRFVMQFFKLEKCQFPLVLIIFAVFKKTFENWRARCFFDFLFPSAVSREKPIPTHHGKRGNNKGKIYILEGSRFVHSGHFTSK